MKPVSIRQLWYLTQVGGVKEQTAGTYAEKLAERDLSLLLMTHLIKVKAAASRVS